MARPDVNNDAELRDKVRAAILNADRALKIAHKAVLDANGLTSIYWTEQGEEQMPPASWLAQNLANSVALASSLSHNLVFTMHTRLPPPPRKKP